MLVAAAPAYLRRGSDGDFSRDWEWAAAAEQAGIPYYPKLVVAVPFTPATGRRILVAPGEDRRALVEAILTGARRVAAERAHGVHVLFADAEEARELEAAGLAPRVDFQYHWRNEGYASPEEFLARFSSKRRNTMRRERRRRRARVSPSGRCAATSSRAIRRAGRGAASGFTARRSTGWCGACAS